MREEVTKNFTETLGLFVTRSGYNTAQLARLSGLPRMTLVNWLEGQVQKPRNWEDVVRLAQGLGLTQNETSDLLQSAKFPPFSQLQGQVKVGKEHNLFTFWSEKETPSTKLSPFQVIPDLPTFVGRTAAQQKISSWLTDNQQSRLILIEGMAGVGKTVLAARMAYQLRSLWPDGILWARLDTSSPMTILHLFAETYGQTVTAYNDLDSRSAFVRDTLSSKQALIVLDNVQSSSDIKYLLPPSGSSSVIITTRRRDLVVHGALRLYLEPFTSAEALNLFALFLGEENVYQEQPVFEEIANYVGYLPLGIDIAASRLALEPGWTPIDFLTSLARKGNSATSLMTQDGRCLSSALSTTFNLLTPNMQQFLTAIGRIDDAEFSIERAAKAANVAIVVAEEYLRTLFCLSLVRRGHSECYRMIPVVREYVRVLSGN